MKVIEKTDITMLDTHILDEYIKENYEPVEDKPGYIWFNKRNLQIISMEVLKESLKGWWTSSHSSLHNISNESQEGRERDDEI